MAKSSGLTDIGNLLAVIGGIIMIIFGILAIVDAIVTTLGTSLHTVLQYNYHISFLGGTNGELIGGIITLVLGIVLVYIYKEKKASSGDE